MSNAEVPKGNITNGKATASLILGIISIISIPIITNVRLILSITGLVLGIVGLKELKSLNQRGKKAAISGIICNGLGILIPVLGYVAFISINGTVS